MAIEIRMITLGIEVTRPICSQGNHSDINNQIVVHVRRSVCKLSYFYQILTKILIVSINFLVKIPNINIHASCVVGVELFHADRQTERFDESDVAVCSF